MWRRLLARAHPDAGGDDELFIWCRELQERVTSCRALEAPAAAPARPPEPKPRRDKSRVLFETVLGFGELTARSLELAPSFREPYPAVFRLLAGCPPLEGWPPELRGEALVGADFKRLALAGRMLGLDGPGRGGLYWCAKQVPLSDLHARYLLDRLQAGERPDGWPAEGAV